MIRIVRGAEPRGLKTAARKRLNAAARTFNQHGPSSKELMHELKGYGSRATKLALFRAQKEKCAWCERKTDFSSAPVDHYRPKDGAWRNLPGDERRVDSEFYWWLTWTWSNLLFACARCNDQGHKGNFFPLSHGSARAVVPAAPLTLPLAAPPGDESVERPLLLDPAGGEDPLDHITWSPTNNEGFDRRDWNWTPMGLSDEGDATIRILKLDELAERAQGHVRERLLPSIEEIEQHLAAGRNKEAHSRWNRFLQDYLSPAAEWSAFTWCAIDYLVDGNYRRRHRLAEPPRPGAC